MLYLVVVWFMLALLADLHRINYLMIQMLFLVKARKDENYVCFKKVLPTLNLVCGNTFKNWIQLRKISIDYGRRFWTRGQVNLSFMVLYSLYPIASIFMHLLDIFHFCQLELLYHLFDFIVISVSVAVCLYFSAAINYFYVYHSHVLEEIRIVFRNLLREDIVEESSEMSNYLYKTLLFRLLRKSKQDGTKVCDKDAKTLPQKIQRIIDAIDDSKSELLLLQQSQPF